MAVAINVTVQDGVYPPRNVVAVTGLTVDADFVAVYRRVDGVQQLLRGGSSDGEVSDSSFVVVDAEYPFGVPVSYRAVVNSSANYDTSATTYTLPGGKVALTDAVTGLSVECQTLAWERKTRSRKSSRFKVAERNIVVTGPLGQFESELEIFTETDAAATQLRNLFENATSAIVQYRSSISDVYGNDFYMVVDDYDERRYSQDGTDPRRTWVLQVAEVNAWSELLTTSGYTYADVKAFYSPSGTYASLKADKASYLDVATADWQ